MAVVLGLATSLATASVALAVRTPTPIRPPPLPTTCAAQTGLGPALDATNALMAIPWCGGLSRQYASDGEVQIHKALDNRTIADGSGKASGLKWILHLGLTDVGASIDLAAPPGFTASSLTSPVVNGSPGFALEAPLHKYWNLDVSARLAGRIAVKAGGTTLLDYRFQPKMGIYVHDFRLKTATRVNTTEQDRPRLVAGTVGAHLILGGTGVLPGQIPIDLSATVANGQLSLNGPVADLKMDLGPVGAHFNGGFSIKLLPIEPRFASSVHAPPFLEATLFDTTLQLVKYAVDGKISVKVKHVGKVEVPFHLGWYDFLPGFNQLTQALQAIQPPLPRDFGSPVPAGRYPLGAPSSLPDYGAAALQLEQRITSHLLFGAVLSLDYPFGRGGKPTAAPTYGLEADSPIWTGHYLAAEALRFAATHDSAALDRVKTLLGGLQRLFDVTQDAAGEPKASAAASSIPKPPAGSRLPTGARPVEQRAPVVVGPGIFARTARPSTSSIDYTDGPLDKRGCWYEAPDGGWRLRVGSHNVGPTRPFPNYAALYAAYRRLTLRDRLTAVAIPVGTDWFGWGCGDDHAISRDQYLGVFFGLAFAYQFVDDPAVRDQTRALIDSALGYLIAHNWNVVLPPDNRIQTFFLGNYDIQLELLRVGATVDPQRWADTYRKYAPAGDLTWIPIWFSTLEPMSSYFKFNLAHAAFAPLLTLEPSGDVRASYERAYNLLWRAVRGHRNAYFDLMHLLFAGDLARPGVAAQPTSPATTVSLRDEVRSVLSEWLDRLSAVPGPNLLPRDILADRQFEQGLWPQDVTRYTPIGGGPGCLAKFPLPVRARVGDGLDFAWQRSPFGTGIPSAKCPGRSQPTTDEIFANASDQHREGSGVDYLLAYWLGAYLSALPPPGNSGA